MATFSDADRRAVWAKRPYEGHDVFGRPMTFSNFEIDHIYPESKGGSSTIGNLQPLARLSNEEKADQLSGYVNRKAFSVTISAYVGHKVIGKLHI